ncbi:MAG: hypothetical protein LUG96_06225 [Tannerellaceae bacterium]|nr:hypothetical protein [Tannerellaceae bacterium]
MEQSRYGQRNQFFVSPPFEKATLPGRKPSFSLSLKKRVAIKNGRSVWLPDERALNVSRWQWGRGMWFPGSCLVTLVTGGPVLS